MIESPDPSHPAVGWRSPERIGNLLPEESTIPATNQDCIRACRGYLDQFFSCYPDAALQKRALKAMRLLVACDEPMRGKPAGWAAAIVYAVANRDRQACGVPGILNDDFEAFFDVSMGTVRKRSAQITKFLDW